MMKPETYLVNGIKHELPENKSQAFKDFIEEMRKKLITETTIISSIRINGSELSEGDETILGSQPLSKIGRIEIKTVHPRVLAEETLQTLIRFTENLEFICQNTAYKFMNGENPAIELERLIEGMGLMIEGLARAKKTLRIGSITSVDTLEHDLLALMKDIASSYEDGEYQYVSDLLYQYVPINLRKWREEGIPALIQSRDT